MALYEFFSCKILKILQPRIKSLTNNIKVDLALMYKDVVLMVMKAKATLDDFKLDTDQLLFEL
jgi:hypothetical protein